MAIEIKTKEGLILLLEEYFTEDYLDKILGILKIDKTWEDLEKEIIEEWLKESLSY